VSDVATCKAHIDRVIARASQVILGKDRPLRLALACLLARGHLLIEDVPGMGKTTLAHVLARCLGLQFQRIQFTSDLLPADILGASVFNRESHTFQFVAGPIFAQLILADEVNRTTPKTQSALLEAMEENQVTVEGVTHPLPTPFFVIATQNPHYQIGTFALPESQLDRFMMRIPMGYPGREAERALLKGEDRRDTMQALMPALTPDDLLAMQRIVPTLHASDALVDYVQALLEYTRTAPYYQTGLSPRAGLALLRGAQAWALQNGRNHVLPEDIQAVLPHVVGHRLLPAVEHRETPTEELVAKLREVAVP
jgi:MoxR-like ATPase